MKFRIPDCQKCSISSFSMANIMSADSHATPTADPSRIVVISFGPAYEIHGLEAPFFPERYFRVALVHMKSVDFDLDEEVGNSNLVKSEEHHIYYSNSYRINSYLGTEWTLCLEGFIDKSKLSNMVKDLAEFYVKHFNCKLICQREEIKEDDLSKFLVEQPESMFQQKGVLITEQEL